MMATATNPIFQENSSNMCCDDEYLKTHKPESCPITYYLGMNISTYFVNSYFIIHYYNNFGFKKYLFSDQYVKSVEWKKLTNVNQGTIIKERFEIIHLPSGKKHASKK